MQVQKQHSATLQSLSRRLAAALLLVGALTPALAGAAEPETVVQVTDPAMSARELIRQGKYDQAILLLRARLSAIPGDDEARLQLARLLYWRGRLDDAERETQDVLSRHPGDIDALELAAQLRTARGDRPGAVAIYRQMQEMGDARPEIQQRVVDLLVEQEDTPAVRTALRGGGRLTDEQELRITRIDHPILADATLGTTYHSAAWWPRVEAGLGYRLGAAATLVAGAYAEQRTFRTTPANAWAPKLEGYFAAGRWSWMLHASGSPSESFLPALDLRADVSVGLSERLGLGLWLRYAHYAPKGEAPASPITIGPNIPINLGMWQVTPGWILLNRNPGGWNHTAFVKVRLQQDARTAWFLWLYGGQDPSYIDRLSAGTGIGITTLLGFDHWLNGRFGFRVTASRNQPVGNFDGFCEFTVGVRGRL